MEAEVKVSWYKDTGKLYTAEMVSIMFENPSYISVEDLKRQIVVRQRAMVADWVHHGFYVVVSSADHTYLPFVEHLFLPGAFEGVLPLRRVE